MLNIHFSNNEYYLIHAMFAFNSFVSRMYAIC